MIRQIPFRPVASTTGRLLSTPISRATPFTSTRCLSAEAATTAATTSAAPPPPPPSPSPRSPRIKSTSPSSETAPKSTASAPIKPRQLTYHLERTLSNNLAIYDISKTGGTRKLTQVKKIVGNPQDLKRDVIKELGFKKDDVTINPVTRHLIIKGHHQRKVEAWLLARGL